MLCVPACLGLMLVLGADTLPVREPALRLAGESAAETADGPWRPPPPAVADDPSGPEAPEGPWRPAALASAEAPLAADTMRRRAVVELSDGYYTRLAIHRTGSWLMLPMFAAQYYAGDQLMRRGDDAPEWVRSAHGPLAAGVATLFTVNTVTGVWNAWEARREPEGRGRRLLHSALMLAADAGFTATGLMAEDAEESSSRRELHRTVALASMGTAVAGWLIMLPLFGGGN